MIKVPIRGKSGEDKARLEGSEVTGHLSAKAQGARSVQGRAGRGEWGEKVGGTAQGGGGKQREKRGDEGTLLTSLRSEAWEPSNEQETDDATQVNAGGKLGA